MRDWCLGARTLFGVERGDAMHDFQRRLTGHRCPCTQGMQCPILPAASTVEDEDFADWEDSVAALDSVTPQSRLLRVLN